ncbi:hypothetical protein [Marinibactrum halimedae]|uniref:Uncharacterized protein n=1 Tax=Marinibactrum halimedae TaxID=1444977 RepID=A0AA37T5X7_9GAMM|nr:hypothetical protein [Marinibactrum halimedae]MCD9457955.1 hypothetical protein [Marinibactrum halimedae]GLS26214.1 hypothetical protein GCM10007877_19290 [Marinibactrum halimedae]
MPTYTRTTSIIKTYRAIVPVVGTAVLIIGLLCHPCSADNDNLEFSYIPDYLHPNAFFHKETQYNDSNERHFSTYAMDNEDLEMAVANFSDGSINTMQRLMNHQWLYQAHYDIKLKKGSKVLSRFLQDSLYTYWKNRRKSQSNTSDLANSHNQQDIHQVDYRMRLSDDSLKLSVSYEF